MACTTGEQKVELRASFFFFFAFRQTVCVYSCVFLRIFFRAEPVELRGEGGGETTDLFYLFCLAVRPEFFAWPCRVSRFWYIHALLRCGTFLHDRYFRRRLLGRPSDGAFEVWTVFIAELFRGGEVRGEMACCQELVDLFSCFFLFSGGAVRRQDEHTRGWWPRFRRELRA